MESKKYIIFRAIIRFCFIIVNVLYAIPTYLVWMAILWPLRHWQPNIFYGIEGIAYSWLHQQVAFWCWTAGYTVVETGDDVAECIADKSVVLANHQSTSDVPLVMNILSDVRKKWVATNVCWIMEDIFRWTPFGWIGMIHGDFFIKQGKETRSLQVNDLANHLQQVYLTRSYKWIILFPEGGFLRKRLKKSQEYAKKNGYPVLQHVTLPRLGAVKAIFNELAQTHSKQLNGGHAKADDDLLPIEEKKPLQWVIDMTICYPDGRPLDCFCVLFAHRPPCVTLVHYRRYRADQIPHEEDKIMQWLYDRWTEKDEILKSYYSLEDSLQGRRLVSVSPVKCVLINLACMFSTYIHLRMITSVYSILFG